MLDSGDLVLVISPSDADARPIAGLPPTLLKIDGFMPTLGLSGELDPPALATKTLPGVFVGDNETGKANAAETLWFLDFAGVIRGSGTARTGSFVAVLGVLGTIGCVDVDGAACSVVSTAIADSVDSTGSFVVTGGASITDEGRSRSGGFLSGVRDADNRGLTKAFFRGENLREVCFDDDSQGAFGVFEISNLAAFIGVLGIVVCSSVRSAGGGEPVDGPRLCRSSMKWSIFGLLDGCSPVAAETVTVSEALESVDIETSALEGGSEPSFEVVSISTANDSRGSTSGLNRLMGSLSSSDSISGGRARLLVACALDVPAG